MMVQMVWLGVATLLITSSYAEYDVKKYCQLIQSGTKLPSPESDQVYYTCLGNNMAIKSTCPDNKVFDKDDQNCVAASESISYFGDSNPCQNKNNEYAYCSNGCNWYNYCVDGQIVGNGTCEIGERFVVATGTCVYGKCDGGSDKEADVNMCDIMPDGVYFGDFKNCQDWHKCSATYEEHGTCEGSLVFDVVSGFCLSNKGNICQRTNNVAPSLASGPPQEACTSENQMVGDTNVCSIYYACRLKTQSPATTYEWVPLNCKNQYFDVISQQCRDHTSARAYPGCDRCEFTASYTSTYWANAVNPSCQQYFTCRKGKQVGAKLGSCQEDYYFDESAQYCIEGDDRLKDYEVYNGACQNYICNDLRVCSVPA